MNIPPEGLQIFFWAPSCSQKIRWIAVGAMGDFEAWYCLVIAFREPPFLQYIVGYASQIVRWERLAALINVDTSLCIDFLQNGQIWLIYWRQA